VRRAVLIALTAAGLAAAPAAQAATKSVTLGLPGKTADRFQNKYGADSNNFFPKNTYIHVGDSVRFVPGGFHDVNLPKKGRKNLPLFVPSGTASGVKDAAGNLFWFNGRPTFGFNPTLLNFNWGKTVSYNGSAAVTSGLPVLPKIKPMTVRFTKTGAFFYYCDIHPGMRGIVDVVPGNAAIPSARQARRALAHQIANDEKVAKTLAAKTRVPARTVSMGAASSTGVEFFGFLPATLRVARGTTVKFAMPTKSREPHSATFGPGPATKGTTYVGQIASTFEGPGPFDPRATYPSEPTPGTLTSTIHGNGFYNTGLLSSASSTLAQATTITFGQAGTFDYYCLIHPFMHGKVIVS
jgi:plastocyanin